MTTKNMTLKSSLLAIAAFAAVAGCNGPVVEDYQPPALRKQKETVVAGVDAGIKVEPSTQDIFKEANNRLFATRANPFVLTSAQAKFEREQYTERVTSTMGGWFSDVQVPEDKDVIPTIEPQPYRRLSGVIVGSSVLALIDMGDGREIIVRPGQMIPGTPWTVSSIDGDKATLTRSGNVQPKVVFVPLQGKIPVVSGGGSGGQGGEGNPEGGPSPASRGRTRASGGGGGRPNGEGS
ncbi:MAG: hypothetical protein JST35_12865 [Armatimonadetes bacterium]|nr:hypothetical protein [Armatimonadota bacterium]